MSSGFRVVDSEGTLKPMLRLATPVLIEQLLVMLVAFVDQWLAGRYLEAPHLAAISLIWYVMWVVPTMFGMVAIGASALVARLTGAGQMDDANRIVDQAFAAGGILCIFAMGLSWLCARPFVEAMQLEPEAAKLALRYFWFLIPLYPAVMIQQVGVAALRGAGDTLSGFVAMSIVNVVNTVVGIALVTGAGPFPELGWDGLAIGTALGYFVGAIIVMVYLLRGRAGLRITRGCFHPQAEPIRRILRIGIPGGSDVLSMTLCHLWFLAIINSLGTMEAAAHGLSVRIESIAYLPGTAFQVAAATMAGQVRGGEAVETGATKCLRSLFFWRHLHDDHGRFDVRICTTDDALLPGRTNARRRGYRSAVVAYRRVLHPVPGGPNDRRWCVARRWRHAMDVCDHVVWIALCAHPTGVLVCDG